MAVLTDLNFDSLGLLFAHLKNHSTTQSLLMLVEKVKQGLIAGDKTGVVFFDFADAFGMLSLLNCFLCKK